MNKLLSVILLITVLSSNGNSEECFYLPNGLPIGSSADISGYIPPDAERFTIDLLDKDGEYTLFRFNPRFDERVIAMNHCINGVCLNEEKSREFPLSKPKVVNFRFFAAKKNYRIAIDGEEFATFDYKFPLSISTENICVDGSLLNVRILYYEPGAKPNRILIPKSLNLPFKNIPKKLS